MKKFVSSEKLSKKARNELNQKQRALWQMNPVTRTTKNPRAYDRAKIRRTSIDV
jgi:hypothetical protein